MISSWQHLLLSFLLLPHILPSFGLLPSYLLLSHLLPSFRLLLSYLLVTYLLLSNSPTSHRLVICSHSPKVFLYPTLLSSLFASYFLLSYLLQSVGHLLPLLYLLPRYLLRSFFASYTPSFVGPPPFRPCMEAALQPDSIISERTALFDQGPGVGEGCHQRVRVM